MYRPSLESSLAALLHDPIGNIALSQLDETRAAHAFLDRDPFGEVPALGRAAALVDPDLDPTAWVEHRLWCAKRRALGSARPPLDVHVAGSTHMEETDGYPTVLVSVMTLDTYDALTAMSHLCDGRPQVVFGEGVTSADVATAGIEVAEGASEVRQVLDVLRIGGVYATYGDFAYAGRSVVPVTLFNRVRPMSKGWARIAGRDSTMLLPVAIVKRGPALRVCVEEPTLVRGRGAPEEIAQFLASVLEDLIRTHAREQWLLLPTLTFEATQAAS